MIIKTGLILLLNFILISTAFSQTVVETPAASERGKFSIGVMASPDICYRSLFNNDGSESSERLIDFRNDIEAVKVGFTGGVDLDYKLNNHLTILTGLYYSKKGFRIDIDDLFFGDVIDPRYGFTYNTTTELVSLSYNFHYLDIPIQMTYIKGSRKARWASSLGLTTNILVKSTNRTVFKVNNDEKQVRVYDETSEYRSINLSATISSGIDYELNKKISLRAAPSFQYNLIEMKVTPITMRLWSVGLNISCRYYL